MLRRESTAYPVPPWTGLTSLRTRKRTCTSSGVSGRENKRRSIHAGREAGSSSRDSGANGLQAQAACLKQV